jgi:DNA-binding IclR family transcriptional regulator
VQSIERAAAILRLLAAAGDPLSLHEVARALGLAKGTAHGILGTLRLVGFVDQERATGRYRIGVGLLDLASQRIDPHDLRSTATNLADSLAARSGHAVRIGVLRAGQVLVVHHVFRPDNSPQTLDVGSSLPAHATALGKALLAFERAPAGHTPEQPGLEPYTRRTTTAPALLRAALAEIRSRGWADEVAEYLPHEAGVAAPIRARGGLLAGAVGINGPIDQVCDPLHPRPVLVTMVRETARAISSELWDPR